MEQTAERESRVTSRQESEAQCTDSMLESQWQHAVTLKTAAAAANQKERKKKEKEGKGKKRKRTHASASAFE